MTNLASERYLKRQENCEKFVRYLMRLRDGDNGRAAMAVLRRSVGKTPEEAYEANRYLAKWVSGDDPKHLWTRHTRFLIASLFGVYPDQVVEEGSLGTHLAALCMERDGFRAAAVERHLKRLLSADRDDLGRHLHYVIRMLQAKDKRVNWAQLMNDVLAWRTPESALRVKYRWSQDFWSAVPEDQINKD